MSEFSSKSDWLKHFDGKIPSNAFLTKNNQSFEGEKGFRFFVKSQHLIQIFWRKNIVKKSTNNFHLTNKLPIKKAGLDFSCQIPWVIFLLSFDGKIRSKLTTRIFRQIAIFVMIFQLFWRKINQIAKLIESQNDRFHLTEKLNQN